VIWIARNSEVPVPPASPRSTNAIAVIPFRDLSGSSEGQMLTDGLSATISARLAEASGVRVAAPVGGSSIAADADPRAIARATGADLVVQGGVQRAGDQIRVNFSVLDPETGTHFGGETLTGTASDLFTLQDRVADRVMEKLNLRARMPLAPSKKTQLAAAGDQQTFLEASGLLWRMKDEGSVNTAVAKLESLLRNARDSAEVNGLLGRAYLIRYRRNLRPSDLEQARLFAARAVDLDADLAASHVTLGEVHSNTGRHADAEREFRRALELQPNIAAAVVGLADALALQGRSADAEREYLRAVQVAPDWQGVFAKTGGFYYNRGDYEKAIRYWTRQAELIPDSPRPYANLGAAHQAAGRYEQALELYTRSLAIQPTSNGYTNRGTCEYQMGRFDDAVASFRKATEMTPEDPTLWMNLGDALRWSREGKQWPAMRMSGPSKPQRQSPRRTRRIRFRTSSSPSPAQRTASRWKRKRPSSTLCDSIRRTP
jgi:tetratricopeptide (TPR) repeat protein